MNAGRGDIEFYFDFVSHNAYLAWTQLYGLAARYARVVRPVPVLFGGLLRAYGQSGPAEIPPKNAWMLRNVLRKAAAAGIPISPPASHPFNPLLALRVLCQPLDDDAARRLIDRLFRAVWCDALDVSDRELVARLANEEGLDGAELIRHCDDPAVKARLREQTELALRDGVFGVPSMRVDGELFWGYDDFAFLELYLRGEDPLPAAALERWRQVRPSVTRRR